MFCENHIEVTANKKDNDFDNHSCRSPIVSIPYSLFKQRKTEVAIILLRVLG